MEELVPGYSHGVTLPQDVFMYVMCLLTIFRAIKEIILGCFALKATSPW